MPGHAEKILSLFSVDHLKKTHELIINAISCVAFLIMFIVIDKKVTKYSNTHEEIVDHPVSNYCFFYQYSGNAKFSLATTNFAHSYGLEAYNFKNNYFLSNMVYAGDFKPNYSCGNWDLNGTLVGVSCDLNSNDYSGIVFTIKYANQSNYYDYTENQGAQYPLAFDDDILNYLNFIQYLQQVDSNFFLITSADFAKQVYTTSCDIFCYLQDNSVLFDNCQFFQNGTVCFDVQRIFTQIYTTNLQELNRLYNNKNLKYICNVSVEEGSISFVLRCYGYTAALFFLFKYLVKVGYNAIYIKDITLKHRETEMQ